MITFSEFIKQMDEMALRPAKYKPNAVPHAISKTGGAGLNLFKVVKPQRIQPYRPFSQTKNKSNVVGEK